MVLGASRDARTTVLRASLLVGKKLLIPQFKP